MAITKLQSPPVREVSISTLTNDFARINWETVGEGFRYEIQFRNAVSLEALSKKEYTQVSPIAYTANTTYFQQISNYETYYQWRVRAVYANFSDGEFTESLIGVTPSTNDYNLDTQVEFTLADSFIKNRLTDNNDAYLNSKNTLQATLMRPGFEFNTNTYDYNSASEFFVTNPGFSTNYGQIPTVCNSGMDREIPAIIDDVIYVFERWQELCKVSNDGGANWFVYKALNDRLGFPVDDCVCQQNDQFSYVLGYRFLIQGVPSLEVDWSHDNNSVYSHASNDLTYDPTAVDFGFDFDVELFTNLAALPPAVSTLADAFNVDNWMSVVSYNNTWVWHNNAFSTVDTGTRSPSIGDRVFEYTGHNEDGTPNYDEYPIVPNDPSRPNFDEKTNNVAVKKIQHYVDPTDSTELGNDVGSFYVLVMGEWILNDNGERIGVEDPNEIRGIWRMNRTPVYGDSSQPNSIVSFKDFSFTRVYGETANERLSISENSTISVDETNLIVGHDLVPFYGASGEPVYDNRQESTGSEGEFHSSPENTYGTIDDAELVSSNPNVSEAVSFFLRPHYTTAKRPGLQIIATQNGVDWFHKAQDYYGASYFNWMHRSKTRDNKSWAKEIIYLKPKTVFTLDFDDDIDRWSEKRTENNYAFNAPNLTIRGFNGYADGAIIHSAKDNRVVGYYRFIYRVNIQADIIWNPNNTVVTGNLINYTPETVEPFKETVSKELDPELSALIYKMAPENYLDTDGMYRPFIASYMKYISEANDSSYSTLRNLMSSHYPRDADQYTEYLHKLIFERNRILDADKKEAVTRFFLAKRADFYGTKGVIDSYKFLFKLLYNEDVDLEIESLNSYEYFLEIESNDVTADIVGRRIYSTDGSADISYYERQYINGKRYWKFSLNNLIGSFAVDDVIKIDGFDFVGRGLSIIIGDIIDYDASDFANRSKSYYVMKLRTTLQLSQYKDDVIRFVHPMGFNFLGITLLTVLINHGNSIQRIETTVDILNTLRTDAGIGKRFPSATSRLDLNGDRMYDDFGALIMIPHSKSLQDPLDYAVHDRVNGTVGITKEEYNDYWSKDRAVAANETKVIDDVRYIEAPSESLELGGVERILNPNYNPTVKTQLADDNGSIHWNLTPYERAAEYSPSVSSGWASVTDMINDKSRRLKDNIGNPYDPSSPSQIHIGK